MFRTLMLLLETLKNSSGWSLLAGLYSQVKWSLQELQVRHIHRANFRSQKQKGASQWIILLLNYSLDSQPI